MKKFKYKDKIFESEYDNEIAPVLIETETIEHKVDIKKLQNKHKGEKIYCYNTNTFNEKTRKLEPISYYYVGAKCIDSKKYKHIEKYNYESPPSNMSIEIILQLEKYKKKFYKNIKNINCSMIDLISNAIEEIKYVLPRSSEYEYSLSLYDEGGWQIEIDVDETNIEDYITSIRLVEEIENKIKGCN